MGGLASGLFAGERVLFSVGLEGGGESQKEVPGSFSVSGCSVLARIHRKTSIFEAY